MATVYYFGLRGHNDRDWAWLSRRQDVRYERRFSRGKKRAVEATARAWECSMAEVRASLRGR